MQYKIEKPCTEDWNKMIPVEGGRFCEQCQMKVYDLTEDATIPSNTESFCGRIYKTRISQINFTKLYSKQKPFQFLILAVSLFFSRNLKSQTEKTKDNKIDRPSQNPDKEKNKTLSVKGTLKDKETKKIISHAGIVAKNISDSVIIGSTMTDEKGNFSLILDKNKITGKSFNIEINRPENYTETIIKNIPANSKKGFVLDIGLNFEPSFRSTDTGKITVDPK